MKYKISDKITLAVRREVHKLFSIEQNIFINKSTLLIELKESTELYLISKKFEKLLKEINIKPFCAGVEIGSIRKKKFYPSLALIQLLAEKVKKKVTVTEPAANLFICGRDIFSKSVIRIDESVRKNDIVIILNKSEEALGIGKVIVNSITIKELGNKVVIKNLLDLGDYIRRKEGKDLIH